LQWRERFLDQVCPCFRSLINIEAHRAAYCQHLPSSDRSCDRGCSSSLCFLMKQKPIAVYVRLVSDSGVAALGLGQVSLSSDSGLYSTSLINSASDEIGVYLGSSSLFMSVFNGSWLSLSKVMIVIPHNHL